MSTFGCIVADPPWKYANFSAKAHGAAVAHYAGMTLDQLAEVRPERWAADDCVLALWCTWPKAAEGIDLMAMWGFGYVTGVPWVKTTSAGEIARGVGFWTMGATEMLLIGRRGHPQLRDRKNTPIGLLTENEAVFYAPRKKHSEKPEGMQDWLERKVSGPYLELFARRERPGWTCWGLELGHELGPWGMREVAIASS